MPKLHIYKNEKETCYAFAEWIFELIKETLNKQVRFTIALSGCDIPKLLFKILSSEYANKIEWNRIHVFWSEEKFVSQQDKKDNGEMALEACLQNVPLPEDQIHSIQPSISPADTAMQYDELLRTYFKDNQTTFDLVILGIGKHGNLLSLLPGNEESINTENYVMEVYDDQENAFKIMLTIPAINASSVKAFLLTGKSKEDVVQQVLKGKYNPEKYPAQLIMATNKSVHWFLDEGAAGKLISPVS